MISTSLDIFFELDKNLCITDATQLLNEFFVFLEKNKISIQKNTENSIYWFETLKNNGSDQDFFKLFNIKKDSLPNYLKNLNLFHDLRIIHDINILMTHPDYFNYVKSKWINFKYNIIGDQSFQNWELHLVKAFLITCNNKNERINYNKSLPELFIGNAIDCIYVKGNYIYKQDEQLNIKEKQLFSKINSQIDFLLNKKLAA